MAVDPTESEIVRRSVAAGLDDTGIHNVIAAYRAKHGGAIQQQTYQGEGAPTFNGGLPPDVAHTSLTAADRNATAGQGPFIPSTAETMPHSSPRIASGVAGGIAGGIIGTGIGGPVGGWVGRGVGNLVGDYAGTALSGEKPSLGESAAVGGINMLTEGLAKGVGYVSGRAGGVSKEAARAGIADPSIIAANEPGAFKKAAANISADAEKSLGTLNAASPHVAYLHMLEQNAAKRVDPSYIIDSIKAHHSGAVIGSESVVDRTMQRAINDLQSQVGTDGKIPLRYLSNWVDKNLSEPAAPVYAKGSEQAFANRVAKIRDRVAPWLYDQVGPGAAAAQQAAHLSMQPAEGINKLLPAQTIDKVNISTPGKLREVLLDTDMGQEVRDRLTAFDAQNGTHHLATVRRLAYSSEWTSNMQKEAQVIMDNALTGYIRPGAWAGLGRMIGRGMIRKATVAGSTAGAATAAFNEAMRRPSP